MCRKCKEVKSLSSKASIPRCKISGRSVAPKVLLAPIVGCSRDDVPVCFAKTVLLDAEHVVPVKATLPRSVGPVQASRQPTTTQHSLFGMGTAMPKDIGVPHHQQLRTSAFTVQFPTTTEGPSLFPTSTSSPLPPPPLPPNPPQPLSRAPYLAFTLTLLLFRLRTAKFSFHFIYHNYTRSFPLPYMLLTLFLISGSCFLPI